MASRNLYWLKVKIGRRLKDECTDSFFMGIIKQIIGKKESIYYHLPAGHRDRSVPYPFFSGYERNEVFPQDTDLSPVPQTKKKSQSY